MQIQWSTCCFVLHSRSVPLLRSAGVGWKWKEKDSQYEQQIFSRASALGNFDAQLQVYRSVPVAPSCLTVDSLKFGIIFWSRTRHFQLNPKYFSVFIDFVWMLGQVLRPNVRWGRAILENVIESNDLVTVFFVDYGDIRTISRTSLRQLRGR